MATGEHNEDKLLQLIQEKKFNSEETLKLIEEQLNQHFPLGSEKLHQLLYKLDIDENEANKAFSSADAMQHLARLILVRQKKRLATKKYYSSRQSPWIDTD